MLARLAVRSTAPFAPRTIPVLAPRVLIIRTYAKGRRKSSADAPVPDASDTHTTFTPPGGSKKHKSQHEDITDTALSEEDEIIQKAGEKMTATLDRFKRELAQMESRVSGRVAPSLLDPVRVRLKENKSVEYRLDEVATVGVRDGNVLLITLFDEANLKDVEASIVSAQIPNMLPQRADARSLRIVVPKPTMEARQSITTTASKQAEEIKVKIRASRETGMKSLKKIGWDKNSKIALQMQKVTDQHTREIDDVLAKLKKTVAT